MFSFKDNLILKIAVTMFKISPELKEFQTALIIQLFPHCKNKGQPRKAVFNYLTVEVKYQMLIEENFLKYFLYVLNAII